MLKSIIFPLTVPNRISNGGTDFLYSHLGFIAAYSSKPAKDWPVDFAKLWSHESDSLYNHVSLRVTKQWWSDY